MAFEQTRFTIIANAAGSGTWRMWSYMPSPDTSDDDITEPGYFGAMEGHIHAGDVMFVSTKHVVCMMAFAITDDGIEAVEMAAADMPESNMQPMPQVLPGGTQPTIGAEMPDVDTANEAVSGPAAEHMEHNSPETAHAAPAAPAASE